jgi:hypothetical protein
MKYKKFFILIFVKTWFKYKNIIYLGETYMGRREEYVFCEEKNVIWVVPPSTHT